VQRCDRPHRLDQALQAAVVQAPLELVAEHLAEPDAGTDRAHQLQRLLGAARGQVDVERLVPLLLMGLVGAAQHGSGGRVRQGRPSR
jgi:hypothetical protein